MDYKKKIDSTKQNEADVHANEADAEYAVETITAVNSKYAFMQDFVSSNYSEKDAAELKNRNFMIGSPFEFDSAETDEDFERIERLAEESGTASAEDVERVFDRWHRDEFQGRISNSSTIQG